MVRQAKDVTQFFLKEGKSQYGEDVIYKALEGLEIRADEPVDGFPEGSVKFQGWASTSDVDLGNDIVEPTAFQSSLPEYMKRGTTLFMHDWWAIPIGKIVKAEIKIGQGLWVEGIILPTQDGKDVALNIEYGVLDSLSIGFRIVKYTYDDETEIRTIHDLKLYEISVVHLGMNPNAQFSQVKSLSDLPEIIKTIKTTLTASPGGGGSTNKESDMPGENKSPAITSEQTKALADAEKLVQHFPDVEKKLDDHIDEMTSLTEANGKLFKQLEERLKLLDEGKVGKSENDTVIEKMGKEILENQHKLEKAHEAMKAKKDRIPFVEWRKFTPESLVDMKDDNGISLPDLDQKTWRLLGVPIEQDGGEEFHAIKTLRKLATTVSLCHAHQKYAKKSAYAGPQTLKSHAAFKKLAEALDPDWFKAMYSTATGYGDEWVPELMSPELYDLYRLESLVENRIAHFNMPSNPYKWPIKTSGATMYRAGEAAVDNPDELTKSRFGTSNVTFTTETFAVCIPCSPELIEDSLIAMIPEIQKEMMIAAAKGYESMLINGDNTSTHRDTQAGYGSTSPESYEDGLRYLAVDRSATFDTQSSTANVGDGTSAFAAADVRYLRRLMGVYGKKASECVYVASITPYFYILNMAQNTQPGTYGGVGTWRNPDGFVEFDGAPLIVTAEMVETLGAAGLYDSASTHKGILCFNPNGFRIGEKRGYTVEFEKNVRTQQMSFVLTMRKSFQCMAPSTQDPVAYGYNIE